MAHEGLISIVVPVYGVEDYIAECIESLLAQRYRNLEIIVVDDGSPDRSAEICEAYAAHDRRIRIVRKPNGGLVSARKAGVAVATGEYLGFVDGDDWVGSDFFECLHEHAASARADLVISGHVRDFFGKREVIPPRTALGAYDREGVLEALLPVAIYNGVFFQHGVSTYVWNKLFRRSAAAPFVRDINEEIVMGEDAALTYPYLAASSRVCVCGPASYFYRQRSNSIVKSVPHLEREYQRLSALFRYLKQRFEGLGPRAAIAQQLKHYFYAQVLVRSGAVVEAPDGSDWLIPFPKLVRGQRIVVYSSGSFGQHVVGAMRRLRRFELVGWIDEDDDESQRSGLPVTSVDSIAGLDFDLVLIAAIDSQYGEAVARRLQGKGVHRAKISVLRVDFAELDERLRAIGFDVDTFSYSPALR
jgi:glycosyltransferase involved in cell wall biosynthesis